MNTQTIDKLLGLFGVPVKAGDLKTAGDELQRNFPASWVVATLLSLGVRYLVTQAGKAGVPERFAQEFGLEPEQAARIYDGVLRAALTRKENDNG